MFSEPKLVLVHSPRSINKNESWAVYVRYGSDEIPLLYTRSKREALTQLNDLLEEMRSNIIEEKNG